MKYLLKAYNIWEQGPREKQEDSIFPEYGKSEDSDRLFILCDGMGGHSAGEVASGAVCKALSGAVFSACPDTEGSFTDEDFRKALAEAYDALDSKDDGAEKKMGTTLTFLKLHAEGCTIAHIGDSRVYHIRPGKDKDDTEILFQTSDHSLVNDLIKIGELTPEEAKHSRQKNVITRAMQPSMERRPKADLYHTHDIRPGDYFMLCSDGILEHLEEDNIKYIFSDKGGDAGNKVEMIIKVSNQSRDNHSAHIIHITDVIDPIPTENSDTDKKRLPEPFVAEVEDEAPETAEEQVKEQCIIHVQKKKEKSQHVKIWLYVIVICFVLLCIGYGFHNRTDDKAKDKTEEIKRPHTRVPDKRGIMVKQDNQVPVKPERPISYPDQGTVSVEEPKPESGSQLVQGGENSGGTSQTVSTPAAASIQIPVVQQPAAVSDEDKNRSAANQAVSGAFKENGETEQRSEEKKDTIEIK